MSKLSVFLIAIVMVASGQVESHDGPPYPIVVDHPLESGRLDVWADPDVGEGTFIMLIKDSRLASTDAFRISMRARSNRGPHSFVDYVAKRDEELEKSAGSVAFVGKVPFDHEGSWRVGFLVEGEIIEVDVDVTPPGPNRVEFLIYLLPFIGVGFLWGKKMLRRN